MTNLPAETVNVMRYTETPGFEGEVEWRIDPEGAWVRFEDVWPEIVQLRGEMKRINDLAIHLNSGGRDPNEKCYSKRDVEALVAISRAVEKMHGSSVTRPPEP